MRCKKCGYTIEEEQSFCNMCGAEQAKIKIKEKIEVRTLFGLLKLASKNHRLMFYNFFIGIALLVYLFYSNLTSDIYVSPLLIWSLASIIVLLLVHTVVQTFKGFKNPSATYTKRYKYALRLVWVGYISCFMYLLLEVQLPGGLIELTKRLLY